MFFFSFNKPKASHYGFKKKNGNACLLTKYAAWLDASEDTPNDLFNVDRGADV